MTTMVESHVPFHDRLCVACQLVVLKEGDTTDLGPASLTRALVAKLNLSVSEAAAARWLSGCEVPDGFVRHQIADALGFDGDYYCNYLTSDDPRLVAPMHVQMSNFVHMARNGTGLVALRRTRELTPAALSELGRLA